MQRRFMPGSEWLYFKLYTGTKTADRLLTHHIAVFVHNLMSNGVIDKFFFIRYSDPGFHIRLRLHLSNLDYYSHVFSEFRLHFSACVNTSVVTNVMCDTYVREIERYGINTMLLSEDIFHIDSEAVLNLISYDESYMPRWHQAFLLVDDMIQTFITTVADRRTFTLQCANSYKREFGFESNTYTKQLNDKYRSLRPQIEKVMARDEELSAAYAILENRKTSLSSMATRISDILLHNPTVSLDRLLGSYIHMSINRLFRSENRLNEMVVYDCLNRYYDSMSAREKYASTNLPTQNTI